MTMQERLEAIERRYDELDSLMANPEVSADYTRIQTLAKEQSVHSRHRGDVARISHGVDATR